MTCKFVVLLGIAMTIFSCASTELTEGGRDVQVMKNDPPKGCKEIGIVTSDGGGLGSNDLEARRTRLKNNVAEKGGNYVRMDETGFAGKLIGTAYKCPAN